MTALRHRSIPTIEYLSMDRRSELHLELDDGQIFEIEAASFAHGFITANVVRRLGNLLDGRPCRVVPNTTRVAAVPGRRYCYPDVVIVCGEPQAEDRFEDTLLNPKIIFEVLSKTTKGRDRGRKWELYRGIASLQQYVLIDQYRSHIEVYERSAEKAWAYSFLDEITQELSLPSIACSLPLTQIYEGVSLQPQDFDEDEE